MESIEHRGFVCQGPELASIIIEYRKTKSVKSPRGFGSIPPNWPLFETLMPSSTRRLKPLSGNR